MTYKSRGRSNIEVFLAIAFAGFLVGFVLVLCIGNFFRAKRAQERQRERRLERLAAQANNNNKSKVNIHNDDASTVLDNGSLISQRSEQHQRLISKAQRFQQQQSDNNIAQRRRGNNDFIMTTDSNRNINNPMDSKHEFLLSV